MRLPSNFTNVNNTADSLRPESITSFARARATSRESEWMKLNTV